MHPTSITVDGMVHVLQGPVPDFMINSNRCTCEIESSTKNIYGQIVKELLNSGAVSGVEN